MANITITAANVVPPSTGVTYLPGKIAGESLSAGDWGYIKAADGKIWKAVSTSAAAATVVGMVANSSAAGQPVSVIQKVTDLPIGNVVTPGHLYFLSSSSAGKMYEATDLASDSLVWPNWVCQATAANTISFDCSTPRTPSQIT